MQIASLLYVLNVFLLVISLSRIKGGSIATSAYRCRSLVLVTSNMAVTPAICQYLK